MRKYTSKENSKVNEQDLQKNYSLTPKRLRDNLTVKKQNKIEYEGRPAFSLMQLVSWVKSKLNIDDYTTFLHSKFKYY